MKKTINYVLVNGMPMTGKDCFCNFCLGIIKDSDDGDGAIVSSIDFVKDVARYCGWNGEKTLRDRKFLSNLKDLLTEWNDIPNKKVIEAINKFSKNSRYSKLVFFIMVREPENIEKLLERLGSGITVLVRRPQVEGNEQSNRADSEVMNYNYDYVIENDGDFIKLDRQAVNFCTKVLKF